ncbi:hypothetical protein CEXT_787011 [Caerostris extrusa]|uniref:Uncharacterized protein n=1 Tax=Caerostris extrusa TaxID=172846 RepID=A0AAV4TIX5_CAEEX|nr:hypothetical protein CEXT_787011 [Caerostris extrusa]
MASDVAVKMAGVIVARKEKDFFCTLFLSVQYWLLSNQLEDGVLEVEVADGAQEEEEEVVLKETLEVG